MNPIDALTTTIVAAVTSPLTEFLSWSLEHPACSAGELLERSARLGQQFEQAVFAAGVEAANRYEPAPLCAHCQRPRQRHGRQRRVVVTKRGERAAEFQRFRCPSCGSLASPRYEAWGVRHGCSPELQQTAALLATAAVYRTVETALGQLGIPVSDSSLQRLVGALGGELADAQEAAAQAAADGVDVPRAERAPERLYLEHDGVKARVEGAWRTVRLGVSYATRAEPMDAQGGVPPPEHVRCAAWLTDSDGFLERFYPQAVAAGLYGAREVVLLMDGEEGMWHRLPQLPLPGAKVTEILDFYHAAENLAKATRAVCGEGTAAHEYWFKRLRHSLRAGDSVAVFDGLRSLQARAEGEARRVVSNVIAYLTTHRRRLDYQRLKLDGYHIGSGQIESRCKQVGGRLKRPGANWSRAGVRAMLALHCHCISRPDQPFPVKQLAA